MKEKLLDWGVWVLRILTGVTFVVSGFVKAVDPWGTIYKFEEYMGAMHLDVWPNLLIAGTFAMCLFEFLVGVFLLAGMLRKSTPVLGLLFMAVMLPLTFWLAVWNPVSDCGCFGDAVILTNWQTFWKNVILTLALVFLVRFNHRARCLILPPVQWLGILCSSIFILIVEFAGYEYQPLIDFRPFPVGAQLIAEENIESHESANSDSTDISDSSDSRNEAQSIKFIYEKNGERHEFTIDDELPDEADGWTFVGREEANDDLHVSEASAGSASKTPDSGPDTHDGLRLWSEDGEEDVTEFVLTGEGKQLLLMMPDVSGVSASTTWLINSLREWCGKNGIGMMAVTAGSPEALESWKDLALADYPVYRAEDTVIKEVVRGNPGVVFVEDGKIVWKSTLRAMDTSDFISDAPKNGPETFIHDNGRFLANLSGIFVAVMVLLGALSYTPRMARFFTLPKRRKTPGNGPAEKP